MNQNLNGLKVAILVAEGFEQSDPALGMPRVLLRPYSA